MSTIDPTQPRITFTGPTSYGDLLDLFAHYDGEECDGACASLLGATHIAEFEWWGTDLGPRYVVSIRKLEQMVHLPDNPTHVRSKWESADAFTSLEDAQKYYAELVTAGVARWVEHLHDE